MRCGPRLRRSAPSGSWWRPASKGGPTPNAANGGATSSTLASSLANGLPRSVWCTQRRSFPLSEMVQEDEQLLALRGEGKTWSDISKAFGGRRTDNHVGRPAACAPRPAEG